MRARLFVPVLFAISSVGGLAFAERTGGGGSAHAVHERAVHEHTVHAPMDRAERFRAHGDMHEKANSRGSLHAGRTTSSWVGRSGHSDTSCRPGSSGCGKEVRATTVTRESHFTTAKASTPTAADKQQAARLSQMMQAKLCAKAHCGEQ